MRKKGYKFTRHPLIDSNNDHNKTGLKHEKPARNWENCGCGSGIIFGECCYRSDHRIFNLTRYLDKLKNIKLKMHDLVLDRFLEDYETNPEICDIADKLSDDLNVPRFNQLVNDVLCGHPRIETPNEILASAIRFEALSVDWTLPGYKKPLFREFLQIYLRKASVRVKECYNSFSKSQFSCYEVIRVKKSEGAINNTWVLLRDLFTKKEYIMKDPLICMRLCIWDVVIGRLYRVAGFNLFSTSVFILDQEQHKAFNRILFVFWLKDEIPNNPTILNELKSKFPQLSRDFSHKYASFSGEYIYNGYIREFLKQNSPILIKLMTLINQIAPESPIIIKSPDRKDFLFAECVGELISEKLIKAIEVIRSDVKIFREVSEMDVPNEYSFDYFNVLDESPISEELFDNSITPENLIPLCKEAIVCKIHELFQKTIVFGATALMSNWSMEQKVDAMENINVGPKVRVGFVEIKRNRIKLVTYSKKSMEILFNHIKSILKPFLVQLSAPVYTDITENSREEGQLSERSRNLFSKEIIEYNDLPYVEDLNKFSEMNLENEEEEMDDLQIESRAIRYNLMKRWINQKIPLLGGKTPKESVKDTKKVHLLIDLIKERENEDDKRGEFDPNRTFSTYLGIDIAHYGQQDKSID